jgi:diaminopimelate decarboxylase
MVFNGNGKMQQELDLAVDNGVLVNIDSEFDLEHIILSGKKTGKKARALLRINPDVDPKVHPYVSTGMASSKFGIENKNGHNNCFLNVCLQALWQFPSIKTFLRHLVDSHIDEEQNCL